MSFQYPLQLAFVHHGASVSSPQDAKEGLRHQQEPEEIRLVGTENAVDDTGPPSPRSDVDGDL